MSGLRAASTVPFPIGMILNIQFALWDNLRIYKIINGVFICHLLSILELLVASKLFRHKLFAGARGFQSTSKLDGKNKH